MGELCVSATDFRVHLKELANRVASDKHRIVMARHGLRMVALVSQEDLEFLRKHRPEAAMSTLVEASPSEATGAEPLQPSVETARLEHPDSMEVEEVARIYRATLGATDPSTLRWRGTAYVVLKARTGRYPDESPW